LLNLQQIYSGPSLFGCIAELCAGSNSDKNIGHESGNLRVAALGRSILCTQPTLTHRDAPTGAMPHPSAEHPRGNIPTEQTAPRTKVPWRNDARVMAEYRSERGCIRKLGC
jgi:hypothetical protein